MTPDTERRRRFEGIADEAYEPLQRYLRRRASPADADDVLGDVLLTVWRRIDDIPADAALPWCYGVARRTLANHRRSEGRRDRLVERIGILTPPDVGSDPGDMGGHEELHAALASLPDADREVLMLWAWEELEPREIATVLDTTPNAVSLRLGRAKQRLADAIERQDRAGVGQEVVNGTEEHRP